MTTSSVTLSDRPCVVEKEADRGSVFLWATPQSISTAFERVMKNSGQLTICHEPFTEVYYFGPDRVSKRYGTLCGDVEIQDFSKDWVNKQLIEKAGSARLLVKELAFQAEPFVSTSLLAGSVNIFITRRPDAVYSSLVKLKPDLTEDEFGFRALKRIFDRIQAFQEEMIVIDGTDFRNDPQGIVEKVCDFINVPFSRNLLHWDNGRIRDWRSDEEKSQATYHSTLENSTTILPAPEHSPISVKPEHEDMLRMANGIYDGLRPFML